MQGIKNIIFDLGGVILNLDIPKSEELFLSMGAERFREIFGRGHVNSFIRDYEIGVINDTIFVEELLKLAGDPYTHQHVTDAWNAMLLDFPAERIELLNQLKSKYRIFLFSNTNAIHLVAFREKYATTFPGKVFDDHFEKAYYSHEIRLRKPDVQAFQYVINDSRLNAAETVFVDDMLVNIEGAKAAGLQGLHIDREKGKSILDIDWGI